MIFFSQAAFSAMEPIPKDQVGKYKQVLRDAVQKIELACDNPKATPSTAKGALLGNIEGVGVQQRFFVDKSGAQPSVILEVESLSIRMVNYFTTDSSHKNLVKVSQTQFEMEEVNDGTIVNPDIQVRWVEKISVNCKATPIN